MRAENDAVRQRHVAAENQHLMAETLATLHEECIFEDIATGQVFHGRAGAEAYYRQWWSAFDVTVARAPGQRSYWTEDDIYIAEACYRGHHRGAFLGIEPSFRPIELRFVVIIAFRDGLMAGERFYYDLGSLLRQIGAQPVNEEA